MKLIKESLRHIYKFIKFKNENDEVYFAYCIPYTYSKLIETLKII